MTTHALLRAWLVMMTLTLATSLVLFAGVPVARWLWVAALVAAAFVKGRLVLLCYLELYQAGQWRSAFLAGLALLLVMILVLALL